MRLLTRHWVTVVVFTLLGVGAALAVSALTTPVYEAKTQIFVSAQATADSAALNQGNSFTQARVQSYADIVTSRRVTAPVVDSLNLDLSPEALASKITASAPMGTVLVYITVSDTNAQSAADIANAVAARFGKVVEELEGAPHDGVSPVRLGITQAAITPTRPVSPRPLLNLALGLPLGLLVGIGLVFLRETLDTTIKTTGMLAEVTGLPTLGSVPFDKSVPGHPLADGPAAHTARAEAYRQLRTNLQFAQVDRKPKILVVTSPLPGEGKTSTAANLAMSLAEAGLETCLVDADLRKPKVADTFGLVQDAGLTSVLIGSARVADVLQRAGGLSVLTSGQMPPNPAELLASARMGEVLQELAVDFDMVVVDSAPLLPVADTSGLVPLADGVLMVVRSGKTSRERVQTAVGALRTVGACTLGAILSMASMPARDGYGYGYGGYGDPVGGREPSVPPGPRRRKRGAPGASGVTGTAGLPVDQGVTAELAAGGAGLHDDQVAP